ncbi:pancreatic secretory trypsin inhibitor-like [Cygnus olor]|uniref:pancreatic secretory trypsin inhibitor-like n=1 Tax=Cygnus olor TaxID=8869 RepID=UPI001ADE5BB5|nr:pancreatic secretory trypsin inhibitor-like [Cygnus olor]
MKAIRVFLLLFLALCFYQGDAEPDGAADQGTEADCGNYNLRKGCTKMFDPICGTDDVLYSNECLLCSQNLQRHTNVRIKYRGKCQNLSPRSNPAQN